jgi:hypothetical protein
VSHSAAGHNSSLLSTLQPSVVQCGMATHPSPGRRIENSPPFQGWDCGIEASSPKGTAESLPQKAGYEHRQEIHCVQPSLRDLWEGASEPGSELPVYSQFSLRETGHADQNWLNSSVQLDAAVPAAFNLFIAILALFSFDSASGQNIVRADSTSTFTANPVMLTDTDVSESFVWRAPDFSTAAPSPEARRIAAKLDSHVDVPWCRGDLYFVEKCAFALWADAGRPWSKL